MESDFRSGAREDDPYQQVKLKVSSDATSVVKLMSCPWELRQALVKLHLGWVGYLFAGAGEANLHSSEP